jgi:serine/threonine-protein kinase
VQIYEIGEQEGRPYFSMEFVQGGSLAQKLAGTPLPARHAAELVETLAKAVHAAHERGIIHRDLKPANVMLTADGTPKVTDFGLAKRVNAGPGLTESGAIVGTPSYMAPEQASGKGQHIGPACDVYALGTILYELLTGRPPFRAETPLDTVLQVLSEEPVPPRLLSPKVERDLETICLKCLEKVPQSRYPSARALAEVLRRYLKGEPIEARSSNILDRLARVVGRSQHDVEFGSWGAVMLQLAAILFVEECVVMVVLTRGGPPYPHGWVLASRTVQFIFMGLVFARHRLRKLLPASAVERQMWTVWVSFLIGCVLISVIGWEMDKPDRPLDQMTFYPLWAILSGIGLLVMGSSYWGRCYAFGLGFFLLAVLLPLRLDWSPLGFGLLWSATLAAVGLHLLRLARETDKRVSHGSVAGLSSQ